MSSSIYSPAPPTMDVTRPPSATTPVRTTFPVLPLPANTSRQPVLTPRLIIRPFQPSDLEALYVLRTQQEVMAWTKVGRIDAALAETQAKLDEFLAPNDGKTYNNAICLRSTGELIGMGGIHVLKGEFGWPEMGYMFRKEAWGQGYASEFATAFMKRWSELPREEVEIMVDERTTRGDGTAEECVIGITVDTNAASQNVLKKAAFVKLFVFAARNETKNEFVGEVINLPVFGFFPGRAQKGEQTAC